MQPSAELTVTMIRESQLTKSTNSCSKFNRLRVKTCCNGYVMSYRENGVTHLTEFECSRVIAYFDTDNDNGLNYKE